MAPATSTRKAALVAVTAFVIGACARKDDNGAVTSTTAVADTGATGSPGAATQTALTDANIFAILEGANVADSIQGAIAALKGTSGQVREFGKLMVRDHHAMRAEGQLLAKKLNIVPQPPPNDDADAELQKNVGMLTNTAKGKDFDRAYIDLQVDGHMGVLEKSIKAMAASPNAELKNLLQKATPRVLAHLDRAQAIQKSMK